jgi:hypothetical protein
MRRAAASTEESTISRAKAGSLGELVAKAKIPGRSGVTVTK